jgi:hypothetical protein
MKFDCFLEGRLLRAGKDLFLRDKETRITLGGNLRKSFGNLFSVVFSYQYFNNDSDSLNFDYDGHEVMSKMFVTF